MTLHYKVILRILPFKVSEKDNKPVINVTLKNERKTYHPEEKHFINGSNKMVNS